MTPPTEKQRQQANLERQQANLERHAANRARFAAERFEYLMSLSTPTSSAASPEPRGMLADQPVILVNDTPAPMELPPSQALENFRAATEGD